MTARDHDLVAALDSLIPRYLRALRTAIAEAVGPDRLTMQQLRCLQAIDRAGDSVMTTTKLADLMSVSVPTMSSMLDGLTGRELVERHPVPGDRRRVLLATTERGRVTLSAYQDVMDERHKEIIRNFSDSERNLIAEVVVLLMDSLESLETAPTKHFGEEVKNTAKTQNRENEAG